ncbi:hypothetical protein JHK87_032053 [Glycine soja]|nr:hypothetical protein JHK87_032053 [Glycine soja]
MEFAKPATIGRNNETPAIHTAVRMACDGREWRCHFCGLDRGEELYGGEDGITESLASELRASRPKPTQYVRID